MGIPVKDQITASEQVYQAIAQSIISGEFQPGEKLSEPELARRYGRNRASVRESIRRLVERGLVVHTPRQGTRVATFSLNTYQEVFEVREALEAQACRLACERMTDVEISKLRDTVERHRDELEKIDTQGYAYQFRDGDFHFLIAKGARNSLINRLLCEDYYNLLLIHRRLHRRLPGRGKHALRDHFHILEALEDRNAELAEILMKHHIRAAKLKILETTGGLTL